MANTQILAVVDMAQELCQPKNYRQALLARRLSEEERDAAQTGTLEYPVFMASAERVGHDRRGNPRRQTPADGGQHRFVGAQG